jgi:hypothetical protein
MASSTSELLPRVAECGPASFRGRATNPRPAVDLRSADGVTFSAVPRAVAAGARVLLPALETDITLVIPIPGVSARPLACVLDFLTSRHALERELAWRGRTGEDSATTAHEAWAAQWAATMPGPDLVALASAASYLDVPPLLALAIKKLAASLASKPAAVLRREFGLPDDLAPGEAARVRTDCAGAFDPPGW